MQVIKIGNNCQTSSLSKTNNYKSLTFGKKDIDDEVEISKEK